MKLPDAPFPTPPGVVYRSGKNRGICPRCHVFLVPTSRVVRLPRSERPNATADLRRSADTGMLYFYDGRPISVRHRWFVHERCFMEHYGMPDLPPEVEAACAASFEAFLESETAMLAVDSESADTLTGSDVDALLAQIGREGDW
jgi:hypothetical protein